MPSVPRTAHRSAPNLGCPSVAGCAPVTSPQRDIGGVTALTVQSLVVLEFDGRDLVQGKERLAVALPVLEPDFGSLSRLRMKVVYYCPLATSPFRKNHFADTGRLVPETGSGCCMEV